MKGNEKSGNLPSVMVIIFKINFFWNSFFKILTRDEFANKGGPAARVGRKDNHIGFLKCRRSSVGPSKLFSQ